MHRVLLSDHNADLAQLFGAFDVDGPVNAQKIIRARRDQRVPAGDIPQGTLVNIAVRVACGRVKDCDAGILQLLEIGREETRRISLPSPQFAKVQRHQAQHVDDGSGANQFDRECGISHSALRK